MGISDVWGQHSPQLRKWVGSWSAISSAPTKRSQASCKKSRVLSVKHAGLHAITAISRASRDCNVIAFDAIGGFTFDLSSSTVTMRNATGLVVTGIGIIHGGPGFDDTEGTWDFHLSNAGGRPHADFSFDSSADSVPDGGSAVALLGVALTGLEVLRRRFGAR